MAATSATSAATSNDDAMELSFRNGQYMQLTFSQRKNSNAKCTDSNGVCTIIVCFDNFGNLEGQPVLFIDAFDHELQDVIAQLSLLLKGESMHLKMQYATIIYNKDDNTMTFINDTDTVPFQYDVNKHKPIFNAWYNNVMKRKPTTKSTKDSIYKERRSKSGFEIMTNDVNLGYWHSQHKEHDTEGYGHRLHIGIPSIDSWRTYIIFAVPGDACLWPAVRSLSLFLQFDRNMVITLPLCTIKYTGNTMRFEYTHTAYKKEPVLLIKEFTYIPQLHKEIFERYYTSLCQCFRTATLWHKRWLPIIYIKHKINTIVSKKSTIELDEALTYF